MITRVRVIPGNAAIGTADDPANNRNANEGEAFGGDGGEEAPEQQSVVVIELNGGGEGQGDIGEDDAEAFHSAARSGARGRRSRRCSRWRPRW